MRDTDLYARILGVERTWQVTDVELRLEAGEVEVKVEYARSGSTSISPVWLLPMCPVCTPTGLPARGGSGASEGFLEVPQCRRNTELPHYGQPAPPLQAFDLEAEQGRSRLEADPETLDQLRTLGYLN